MGASIMHGGDVMYATQVSGKSIRFYKIAEAAKECLENSPYQAVRGILCECKLGVLFLRGHLSSFHHKQVAQETVSKIKGINQVVNEIEVD